MYPHIFSEVSKQEYEVSNERANDRANERSLTSDLWRCGQLSMQHKRVRRSFQEGAGPFWGSWRKSKGKFIEVINYKRVFAKEIKVINTTRMVLRFTREGYDVLLWSVPYLRVSWKKYHFLHSFFNQAEHHHALNFQMFRPMQAYNIVNTSKLCLKPVIR